MLSQDAVRMVDEVTPYVTAALTAFGGETLVHVQGETISVEGFGRRLAQSIFGLRRENEELPEAVVDLIEDSDDPDNLGALRKAIRKALVADPDLAEHVRALMAENRGGSRLQNGSQVVMGSRIGRDNIQIGSVGGNVSLSRD